MTATTTKYSDIPECKKRNDRELQYVMDEYLEKFFGDEYPQFTDWMRGQSKYIDATYLCDVENYFRKRDSGRLAAFPHGY